MKTKLYFLASLTLGLLVISCQNGLEEVLEQNAVQDELATTRAEEAYDGIEAIDTVTDVTNLNISGDNIISGIDEVTYAVSYSSASGKTYYIDWDYNTNVLYETSGGDGNTTITLKLISSTNTNDTYLRVRLRETATDPEDYSTRINIGCNGPLANTSSLRVVRSSDGVEVYPSSVGFSPNTWYYAYFTNPYAYNMTLQWIFNHATVYSQYGYTAYFQTDSTGWSLLTINGKMPTSSVYKYMMGVTLYEGYDNSNGSGDESDEESEEQIGNE